MADTVTLECKEAIDGCATLVFTSENILPNNIMRAEMYYNDGNNDPLTHTYDYESNSNLKWMSQSLKPSDIKTGTVNITGLNNGDTYIFKLMIVYRNSSQQILTAWSNQTPDKMVIPRQLAPEIVSGSMNSRDTTTYFVNMSYPNDFFYDPSAAYKLVFLIYNNVLTPSNVNKVLPAQEFVIVPSNPETQFLLTGLQNDKTYEISCFCSSNNSNVSEVSNTILATLSVTPTPPYLPIPTFHYEDGSVTLTTNLLSVGKADDTWFRFVLEILDSTDGPIYAIPLPYVSGMFSTTPIPDYSIRTNHADLTTYFSTGNEYRVRFRAVSSSGTSAASNDILTFTPMKYATAPTLRVTDVNDINGDITFDWSASTLNGATLYTYNLELRTSSASPDPYRQYFLTERNLVAEQLPTRTQYYANVTPIVYNPNYDSVYNRLGRNHIIVSSDKLAGQTSSQVYATSYVKMIAPTLVVSYAQENVNSIATFTMTGPVNSSGISFEKYQIVELDVNGNQVTGGKILDVSLTESQYNIVIDELNNGNVYNFAARSVVNTGTTVSTTDTNLRNKLIYGDLGSSQRIIPWSPPAAPIVEVYATGNHFITLSLSEQNVSATTGVSAFRHFTFGSFSNDNVIPTLSNNRHTFYEKNNGQVYTIQPSAVYFDPNNSTDIAVQGSTLYAEPTYSDSVYKPQKVVATASDNGTITVKWISPTLGRNDDRMVFQEYNIYSILDNEEPQLETPVFTTPLEAVISGLDLGARYQIKVEAVYSDQVSTDGAELASDVSNYIYPYTLADAPLLNNVIPGSTQLTVEYDAPLNSGGGTIVGYRIYYKSGTNFTTENYVDFKPAALINTLYSLINGTRYKVAVAALTSNPNNALQELEGDSDLSSLYYVPRPDTIATIQNFQMDTNASDVAHDVSTGSVELAWTEITDSALLSIGFIYELRQINVSSLSGVTSMSDIQNITTNLIQITDMHSSSYTVNNLPLGVDAIFIINLKVNDPNNVGEYIYGLPPSGPVITSPYDSTPDAINGTAAEGLDHQVNVTWLEEATIGGQAVSHYKVYQRLYTTNNTGVYEVVATQTHSPAELEYATNGDTYQYYVAPVLVTGEEAAISEFGTIQVTATPFAAPTACVIATDKLSAVDGQVVISLSQASQADGSPILGYHLYENGTRVTDNLQTDYVTFPVTITGLDNGTEYSYIARPVYANLNNTSIKLEGPVSNTATKIPFKADIAPTITRIQNVDETHIKVYYSFTADINTGLVLETEELYLDVNGEEDIVTSNPVELTVEAGMLLNLKMRSEFSNPNVVLPNVVLDKISSDYSTMQQFRAYSAPTISSLQPKTVGDGKVYLGLKDIALNSHYSVFQKYIVRTYLAATDDSRLTDVIQGELGEVNVYKQTGIEIENILISGLTNGTSYRFEVTAVGGPQYSSLSITNPNPDLESSPPLFITAVPTAVKVPTIESYRITSTSIILQVQAHYQALTNVLLFISPTLSIYYPDGSSPAQLYYETGPASASTADDSGIMNIPIQLNGITPSSVQMAAIALNDDGKSPTYFYPSPPNNKLSGTYQA